MVQDTAQVAACQFLKTGRLGSTDPDVLATACDRLIQVESTHSFKTAYLSARRFVARAEIHGGILRLTAYRTLARITHLSGHHHKALASYRKARSLATHDPIVVARIDRALTDVLMYVGRFAESERVALRAIEAFRKISSPGDLAQAKVNYANLLHRQDRHQEAADIYRQATDYFATTDNTVALARCYYNLANTQLQLFRVEEADKLYSDALRIWTDAGCELDACDARYGLAWLHMLTGQLDIAMVELTACERQYYDAGDPRGEALCLLDRAEVFLHLGLITDALDTAHSAQRRFAKLKLRYEKSKAALFCAQAALALGRTTEARRALTQAQAGFTRERNRGFLGVAALTQADLSGTPMRVAGQLLRKASRYFTESQLPLWQAVCDLKLAAQSENPAAALERLKSQKAAHHVPHLYALWQTLLGDFELSNGHSHRARDCWKRAADRLDSVRATLPPLELRTAYARNQTSPHGRLVEYEMSRDPLRAAVWSERQKTAGVWSTTSSNREAESRVQVERSLQLLAGQFAALAHQVTGVGGKRGQAAQADRRVILRLQRQIREEFIRRDTHFAQSPDGDDLIREQFDAISRQLPVLQFHVRESDIIAFIHEGGSTRTHRFAGGRSRLIAALERWHFILEGELLPDYPGHLERITAEEALWREIASWLWEPLNIKRTEKRVLVLPEGELANLPWEALRVDGRALGESHSFILAPSIRHYAAACQRHTRSTNVDIFRGVGDNLPFVDAELNSLVLATDHRASLHSPAHRGDWPIEHHAHIWHYSGHALLREDNPFYSALLLDDGPLFAVDFHVRNCCVNLVTLAACRSGEQIALPGEESTGLVRSLLEMGARTVIASRWPVSDQMTAVWMNIFYKSLFEEADIAIASRKAAGGVMKTHPSAFHWAAFGVFGAGDTGD